MQTTGFICFPSFPFGFSIGFPKVWLVFAGFHRFFHKPMEIQGKSNGKAWKTIKSNEKTTGERARPALSPVVFSLLLLVFIGFIGFIRFHGDSWVFIGFHVWRRQDIPGGGSNTAPRRPRRLPDKSPTTRSLSTLQVLQVGGHAGPGDAWAPTSWRAYHTKANSAYL